MSTSPRLLAIHAHPDDECIVTGGVLADSAARGYRTKVLTCTDGRRGDIVDPEMDAEAIAPILHEVREQELAAAMEILGGVEFEFLGYHDSGSRLRMLGLRLVVWGRWCRGRCLRLCHHC